MVAMELLSKNPNPTEDDIRDAISGNLCRCTGYQNIVKAIVSAAKKMRSRYGGCSMTSHLEDHVIPPSRQREKPRGNLKWIGQDMKRVEDPRLLTGKGKYIDDIELAKHGPRCRAR